MVIEQIRDEVLQMRMCTKNGKVSQINMGMDDIVEIKDSIMVESGVSGTSIVYGKSLLQKLMGGELKVFDGINIVLDESLEKGMWQIIGD